MLRLKQNFKFNILIVYPNLICSTKAVYQKNKKRSFFKGKYLDNIKDKKNLINFLRHEPNDLENAAIKIYPKIKNIIELLRSQKGCYFSRITGSGSACIGIFSNIKNAIYAKKKIKLKYPKYWCVVSKTI